jgi:hypothetical protein
MLLVESAWQNVGKDLAWCGFARQVMPYVHLLRLRHRHWIIAQSSQIGDHIGSFLDIRQAAKL